MMCSKGSVIMCLLMDIFGNRNQKRANFILTAKVKSSEMNIDAVD